MKYTPNIRGRHVRLMLLEKVLAQWQRLVVFRKAMNLLHRAMHGVSYRCTATALETARKVGTFYIVVLFAVALADAETIRSKKLLDDSVQWLPV